MSPNQQKQPPALSFSDSESLQLNYVNAYGYFTTPHTFLYTELALPWLSLWIFTQ